MTMHTFSEACTLGAKPLSLFTHVYECKVFARIVCESACAARPCSMEPGLACVSSRKGSESRVVTACAREGVSTLGELPFRAENNGMRVVLPSPHNASPSQTDVEKTVAAFFPFLVGSPLL